MSMNKDEIRNILFGQHFSEHQLPRFKAGDTVRISKYKSTFTKGYAANFMVKVICGDPNVYELIRRP